jgi:hypothetical protein
MFHLHLLWCLFASYYLVNYGLLIWIMCCILIIQNMLVVNAVVSFQVLKFWNVQLHVLRFNLIVSWNWFSVVTYVIITNVRVNDIHTYKLFLEVSHLCSNGHKKPNLITLQVLPFCKYTLAPVVLSLLDAPLESSFGMTETYHCILEFLLLTQNDDFWAKSSVLGKHYVAWHEIWRAWLVWDAWNWLVSQKLLHCDGSVTRSIAMV